MAGLMILETPDGRATPERGRQAVVIRSGGLGDFVLTLPLLKGLGALYPAVALITRACYWQMIRNDGLAFFGLDIDSAEFATAFSRPSPKLAELFAEADIFSLLPDPDGSLVANLLACGARGVALLDPRPQSPPHVTKQMFLKSGLEPHPKFLERPALGRKGAGSALWLHPGSGALAKNALLQLFIDRAKQWHSQTGQRVIVSFGDADLALLAPMRQALASIPHELVVQPSLPVLRQRLEQESARFVGNDSGVTHLAACLGIPGEAFFICTDPAVWAPLGGCFTIYSL